MWRHWSPAPLQAQPAQRGEPDWPGALKGRHRQLVDAYTINDGAPLEFAYTFLATNDALGATCAAATAVVVLRHAAFPLAVGDDIWRRYKIGEAFKVIDPDTKAPALKNPFLRPKSGTSCRWTTWRSTARSRMAWCSAAAMSR